MNIGLIGLGRQGREHLNALISLHNKRIINLTSVCDLNNYNFIKSIANSIKLNTYKCYKEMLSLESLDVVIIATSNDMHYEITVTALKNGIHVLKEKPYSITYKEAIELYNLAKDKQKHLKIFQQRKYHPYYVKAKKWLDYIGDIRYLDYHFSLNDSKLSWYWQRFNGGGCWFGLGWHACWIALNYIGYPESLKLTSFSNKKLNYSYDTEDTVTANLYYEKNIQARFFLSVSYPIKMEKMILDGKNGSIFMDRENIVVYNVSGNIIEHAQTKVTQCELYEKQLEHLINKIQLGKENVDDIDLKIMKIHEDGFNQLQRFQDFYDVNNQSTKINNLITASIL